MKLSADKICAIIKTCAESKVAYFSLGELEVHFQASYPKANDVSMPEQSELDRRISEAVSLEVIEKDEIALKSDELARMEIEDPMAYEKALMTGDLITPSTVGEDFDGEENSGSE